jgi:hypothetical protein
MCTVTFIPLQDGALITSSRDEQISRGVAMHPSLYSSAFGNMMYPKDTKKGGTWFVVKQTGVTGILLNGAFEKHIPNPPYRMSRGLMMLELLSQPDIPAAIQLFSFAGVEPFTLIFWDKVHLVEYRWNGIYLHQQPKDANQPHIWSSATLYNQAMQADRNEWFIHWLAKTPNPGQAYMLDFHLNAGGDNNDYGIRMQRQNGIQTVSITSAQLNHSHVQMQYKDLISGIDFLFEADLQMLASSSDTIFNEK